MLYMTCSSVLFIARANFAGSFFIAFATNFLELATTLKYLGAKWLPEKKVNFTPWGGVHVFLKYTPVSN